MSKGERGDAKARKRGSGKKRPVTTSSQEARKTGHILDGGERVIVLPSGKRKRKLKISVH